MLDKLKEMFKSWKVRASLAGGVLVIATAFGTCYYNPTETSSDVEEADVPAEEASSVRSALTSEEAAALEEAALKVAVEAEGSETELK
tara:strand:+ start:19654 stop:19917 length:264 start_codon:yes stop_codon:yes gene_type:complete